MPFDFYVWFTKHMTVYNPKPTFRYRKRFIICERCKKQYFVDGRGVQRYCSSCRLLVNKEQNKASVKKRKMRIKQNATN